MDRVSLRGAVFGASLVAMAAPGVAAAYGMLAGMAVGLAIVGALALAAVSRKSNPEAI